MDMVVVADNLQAAGRRVLSDRKSPQLRCTARCRFADVQPAFDQLGYRAVVQRTGLDAQCRRTEKPQVNRLFFFCPMHDEGGIAIDCVHADATGETL